MKAIRLTVFVLFLMVTMVPMFAQQESMPDIFNGTAFLRSASPQKPSARITASKKSKHAVQARRHNVPVKDRLLARRARNANAL